MDLLLEAAFNPQAASFKGVQQLEACDDESTLQSSEFSQDSFELSDQSATSSVASGDSGSNSTPAIVIRSVKGRIRIPVQRPTHDVFSDGQLLNTLHPDHQGHHQGHHHGPLEKAVNAKISEFGVGHEQAMRVKKEKRVRPPRFKRTSAKPPPSEDRLKVKICTSRNGLFCCTFRRCKQAFKTKFSLNRHVKTHTGERPFVCTFKGCPKRFAEKSTLKRHLRVHTGEKPYKCAFAGCLKTFADRTNVKRHQLTHLGSRPFRCQYTACYRGFSTAELLQKHMKGHHLNKLSDTKCSSLT